MLVSKQFIERLSKEQNESSLSENLTKIDENERYITLFLFNKLCYIDKSSLLIKDIKTEKLMEVLGNE